MASPHTELSLYVGLGPRAEQLLPALHARVREFEQDFGQWNPPLETEEPLWYPDHGYHFLSGTDPAVMAAWSGEVPLAPADLDLIVLAIDAHDPRACEASRFWARQLAHFGDIGRTALVIGDTARCPDPDGVWRRELSAHFAHVIDIPRQRAILHAATTYYLAEGLLFSLPTIICVDVTDISCICGMGSRRIGGVAAWTQATPDDPRRVSAIRRVWNELLRHVPMQVNGAICFLHGGFDLPIIKDFQWITDHIRDGLPPDGDVVVLFRHHHTWPAGRRRLGLILVGD